jgi:hypothetical protein
MSTDRFQTGSLRGHNFLTAGALLGIDTIGSALRNINQNEQTTTMADYNTAYNGNDLVQRIISDIGIDNFQTIENITTDLSGVDTITINVKETLEKYRKMKAEVVRLLEEQKELDKKTGNTTKLLDELKQHYQKLYNYILSIETTSKYMDYEKALRTELLQKHLEMSQKSSEIGREIGNLEKDIHQITQLIKEGVIGEITEEEVQRLRDPNLCAICVENKVTHVFNPCGHTVCLGCIDPTLTRCHLCRKQIMTKIKIFFS